MVNPVHLRTLLEVVKHGSFAAAAARLGYTASAVSQQMSALERDTGVSLFRRSARSIEPTEAAATMARHARRVLTDIDALLAASTTAEAADGAAAHQLRLGIFPSLATFALPGLMAAPGWTKLAVALRVSVGEPHETLHALTNGELDLAIVFQVGQAGLAWPAQLERQWIGDDRFRVVLPASWGIADGSEVAAAQLAHMPWIMHHPGAADATVIARLFASADLNPRVVAYSDDFNASLSLASAGLGAALVPELAMQQRPAGLAVVDVPEIRLARSIFALRPGAAPGGTRGRAPEAGTAHLDLFMDHLASELARISIGPGR